MLDNNYWQESIHFHGQQLLSQRNSRSGGVQYGVRDKLTRFAICLLLVSP